MKRKAKIRTSIFDVMLITVSLLAPSCFAQDRSPSPFSAHPAAKPLTVSGRLSSDARTLLTDIDTEWSIANSEVVRGREGSFVTVKCLVDSEHNQLRILSLKPAPEVKYASRSGDPAFRR